jgi:hypothetical protein
MTTPKHSPGPWTAKIVPEFGKFEGGYMGTITDANGDFVYSGPADKRSLKGATKEQASANATVMAAAPRMLAALKVICDKDGPDGWFLVTHAELTEALAAIADAEPE